MTTMTSETGEAGTDNLRARYNTAFTFLEILIVISVIGVLAALSLPKFKNTFYDLQLNNFALEMQTFMNYLHERAIVEGKVIYLVMDKEEKDVVARLGDSQARLKTYPVPFDIVLETDKPKILFYPDGQIDKVTITLSNFKSSLSGKTGSFSKTSSTARIFLVRRTFSRAFSSIVFPLPMLKRKAPSFIHLSSFSPRM